jgi:hypothetical protein
MIANPCFHSGCHPQGLVNPAEVVVHVMQRNRVLQILQFFREAVGQSRKSAHRHAHGQILPLNIAGRDMVVIGIAGDDRLACSHADGGTVASFWRILRRTINLLQHREINLRAERIFNRCQIRTMAVRRELHAIREAIFQVMHEVVSASGIAFPDEPARNQLAVGVKSNPRPAIASAFCFLLRKAILFFRVNKRPDFIALDALRAKIAKRFILIFRAGAAKITEKFHNGRAVNAGHARNGAQGIAFNQRSNYLFSFFGTQLIHTSNMLERSSNVNKKVKKFAKGNQLTLRTIWCLACFTKRNECGAGGIPTRGTRERPPDYKSGTLRHSVTAPNRSVSEKAGDVYSITGFSFSCAHHSSSFRRPQRPAPWVWNLSSRLRYD